MWHPVESTFRLGAAGFSFVNASCSCCVLIASSASSSTSSAFWLNLNLFALLRGGFHSIALKRIATLMDGSCSRFQLVKKSLNFGITENSFRILQMDSWLLLSQSDNFSLHSSFSGLHYSAIRHSVYVLCRCRKQGVTLLSQKHTLPTSPTLCCYP